jgi:hypothetical protein
MCDDEVDMPGPTERRVDIVEGHCYGLGDEPIDGWLLDTGATHHFTNCGDHLFGIEARRIRITTGKKDAVMNMQKAGYIRFEPVGISVKSPLILSNVLLSEEACQNIISVPRLVSQGCVVYINGESMIVSHNGKVVCEGRASPSGLYILSSHDVSRYGKILTMREMNVEKIRQVHHRLGHVSVDNIKQMMSALCCRQEIESTLSEDSGRDKSGSRGW